MLSLPLPSLYNLVTAVEKRLVEKGLYDTAGNGPVCSVIGYGHIGDGNVHLNVCVRGYNDAVVRAIEPFVYEYTQEHKGSVSAEHGLGIMKSGALKYSKSDGMISWMYKIKNLFDPNHIMNPYKYLPKRGGESGDRL